VASHSRSRFIPKVTDLLLTDPGSFAHVADRAGASQQHIAFYQMSEPEVRVCLENLLNSA
jgi:hypothetical protein